MVESNHRLGRRGFIKTVGVFAAATSLSSIDFDINRETEQGTGIRIIDNEGMIKEGKVVDVIADPALIRKNILERASLILSPDKVPKVENLVERLTISFGARNLFDVVDTETFKRDGVSIDPTGINRWLTQQIYRHLNFTNDPYGLTFTEHGDPLIYINTPDSHDSGYKFTWDHETSHLIDSVDPEKINYSLGENLQFYAPAVGIDISLGAGSVLAIYEIYRRFKNEKTKSFYVNNDFKIFVSAIGGMVAAALPSLKYASEINYKHFNKIEKYADDEASEFPTPDSEFNKMIRIVPGSL